MENPAEDRLSDDHGRQTDNDSAASHINISKPLILGQKRSGQRHQAVGQHKAQHAAEICIDALRFRHAVIAAGGSEGTSQFRILDFADLTVDGSLCTGGAVCIMTMMSGQNVWVSMLAGTLAGMLAGLATGLLHTFMGIPAILSGILTQLGLYSINLKIMGKANQAVNVDKYDLLVSLRFIRDVPVWKNTIFVVALSILILKRTDVKA